MPSWAAGASSLFPPPCTTVDHIQLLHLGTTLPDHGRKAKGRTLTFTRLWGFGPGKIRQAPDVPRGFPRAELVAVPALVGDDGLRRKQIASQSRFNSVAHVWRVGAAA